MQTGCVSNSGNGGHLAADQLVTTHVWLVRAIAKKVLEKLPSHVELNDLIEDGVFGLIAAAQRYDPARGIPFPLYAKHRIRGAIVDGLRRMDHLSRDLRSKVKKADASTLENEPGRDPASAVWRGSTAGHTWMGMRPERNGTGIAFARAGCSSAKPCEPVADAGSRPDVAAGDAELLGVLRNAMKSLPTRYGQIVTLYHWRGLTMREIGRAFGINESRVSQIHKRALELMAVRLRSKGITSCGSLLR
jgi:RNA polymerase sigma factor for flagellar operon FliA